jgi:hypothetical protein
MGGRKKDGQAQGCVQAFLDATQEEKDVIRKKVYTKERNRIAVYISSVVMQKREEKDYILAPCSFE